MTVRYISGLEKPFAIDCGFVLTSGEAMSVESRRIMVMMGGLELDGFIFVEGRLFMED